MMRNHFDGRPGSEWVNRGLYEIEIINENQPTPLTITNWDDSIVPGMELCMAIILKQQQKSSDRAEQDCPSCGDRYKGYGKCKDLERVRWYLGCYYRTVGAEELIYYPHKSHLPNLVPNIFGATSCRACG
jgi:hypothetical protein